MIHVFFVPGMFGTTIEFVLRSYTREYVPINADILADGSMHSFNKEFHPVSSTTLDRLTSLHKDAIVTPTYPFKQSHLPEILQDYLPKINPSDKKILIYADTIQAAELNLLFRYHKIAFGNKQKLGLNLFFNHNTADFKNWNQSYQSYHDMQPWELREWFSIFYLGHIQEWVDSVQHVDRSWLTISNTEILNNTHNQLLNIIEFCKLTPRRGLGSFVDIWVNSQQYILDEFNLINQVVESTTSESLMTWEPMNIIAEAIVQQRLRQQRYELKCHGLNKFPTDSLTLRKLLYKI